MAEVGLALDAAADRELAPSGLLRLAVSSIAERFGASPSTGRPDRNRMGPAAAGLLVSDLPSAILPLKAKGASSK